MSTKKKLHSWPLAIIITLLIFSGFIVTIAIYLSTREYHLVSDNYYENTLSYDEHLANKRAAEKLAEKPNVSFLSQERKMMIAFPTYDEKVATGEVYFYRPNNSRLDFKVPLQLNAESKMLVASENLQSGWWTVKINWSMGHGSYFTETEINI
ncbi:MAG: FixH family protein [Bacteroidetes bacterium]|nr:FixH family protein [Bacteroidota bacterium]